MAGSFLRPLASLLLVVLVGCSRGELVREQAPARAARAGAVSPTLVATAAQGRKEAPDPFEFDSRFFRKKSAPEPGEWLAEHREHGQSFWEFERTSTLRPTAERRTIVLQPLGEFTEQRSSVLSTLQRVTTLYFGLPVEIARPQPLPTRGRRVR